MFILICSRHDLKSTSFPPSRQISFSGSKNYKPAFVDVGERRVESDVLQHTVSGLVPATDYKLQISATTKCGEGDLSNAASAHTQIEGK